MKRCHGCQMEKPIDQFYKSFKRTSLGVKKPYHTSRCRECIKENQRDYKERKKSGLVAERPPEKKCQVCEVVKSVDAFHSTDKTRKDGSVYEQVSRTCLECASKYGKAWQSEGVTESGSLIRLRWIKLKPEALSDIPAGYFTPAHRYLNKYGAHSPSKRELGGSQAPS